MRRVAAGPRGGERPGEDDVIMYICTSSLVFDSICTLFRFDSIHILYPFLNRIFSFFF